MLNLVAATVVTTWLAGNTVPASCEQGLIDLQAKAGAIEWYFFQGKRPLTVHVVPFTSLPADVREVTAAWSYPRTAPNMIWFRVDVLCSGTQNLIELVLTHEATHLARPDFTHGEVDALVESFHRARFAAYKAELETIGGRAATWRYQHRHWLARATPYPGPPQ